ncbi:sensor domain-containing phosphodiesterase [uncultured Ferrimonas sp.]|uniref:sensor domain-containing phosphodiesterase n=1 Tax=uncultured Ferrimonas sp. TaxID=432640 RepID=UPI0026026762|nr:sensor domain-containing phosphodiesterase [uncultured Ferrimonas sp.]
MSKSSIHPTLITRNDRFIRCNEAFTHAFGYNIDQLQQKSVSEFLFHDEELTLKLIQFQNVDDAEFNIDDVWLCQQAQGEIQPVFFESETLATGEQKLSLRLLQHRGLDPVTSLPNGWAVSIRSDRFFQDPQRHQNLGYLIVKVDNFSTVNFRFSFESGNRYLNKVVQLLQQTLGKEWLVVRFSGAKFGMVHIGDPNQDNAEFQQYVELCCQKLCRAMEAPIELEPGAVVKKQFSIGANANARPFQTFQEMDIATEIAFIHSQGFSRSYYTFAKEHHGGSLLRNKLLIDELPRAVEADQINLVFQPLYHVSTRQVIGFEALSRWQHPQLGHVSPIEFIGVAENTGYNTDFDLYVFAKVCRQVMQWRQRFAHVPPVAVNFSAKTCESSGFAAAVEQVLLQTGCPADAIEIEITETAEISHQEDFFHNMDQLRSLDLLLVLDDFGAGYSSLQLLRQLAYKIGKIKIDREFINDIDTSDFNKVLFKQTIEMSKMLGVKVLAEGIEEESQLQLLEQFQCDFAQGYFLQRPADITATEVLLQQLNSN